MEDISQLQLVFLCGMALLAGLVDSMVGGGGLIQVPALFNALPSALPGTLFGTNKLSAIAGTATACWRYARTVRIDWRIAGPASLAALLCAFLGAKLVSWLPVAAVRPLVLVLLVLMALYTMRQKQLGMVHAPLQDRLAIRWRALAMGGAIGFYDGFFGPGTGSFLLFACVRWFGCDFLRASAIAKVVNLATNLAALAYFIPSGNVLYQIGVPMALCNILGAQIGSRLALRGGVRLVRVLFLLLVWALIIRLAYDVLR